MRANQNVLVQADEVRLSLPAPYCVDVTIREIHEIFDLFQGTTRNPNHCISKGQYHKLAEQLGARNKMLEKRVRELEQVTREMSPRALAWGALESQLPLLRSLIEGEKTAAEIDGAEDESVRLGRELQLFDAVVESAKGE